jgi:hypothetical protein
MKTLGILLILLGFGIAGFGAYQSMNWGWDTPQLTELGLGVGAIVAGFVLRGLTW